MYNQSKAFEVQELVIPLKVQNSDGIHIRPAHVLTTFLKRANELLGYEFLLSRTNTADTQTWRDILLEYSQAVNGFGIRYACFISACLLQNDEVYIKILARDNQPIKNELITLLYDLMADEHTLESGGTSPKFKDYYLCGIEQLYYRAVSPAKNEDIQCHLDGINNQIDLRSTNMCPVDRNLGDI